MVYEYRGYRDADILSRHIDASGANEAQPEVVNDQSKRLLYESIRIKPGVQVSTSATAVGY